jgi:diguanylate cyclase (GGDEF)-like protein
VLSAGADPRSGAAAWWRRAIPHGRTLPPATWTARHHALRRLLWLHAVVLPLVAVLADHAAPQHALAHALPLAALAWLAVRGANRRLQSACVAVGLMTASATLIHLLNGATHAHFHVFVVMSVLALYEDWLPYGLGIAYVLVHQTLLGIVAPQEVFADAENPIALAIVHAGFLSAACVANVVLWRANERARGETEAAARVVELQYEFTRILAREVAVEAAVPALLELVGRRLAWDAGIYWAPDEHHRLRPRVTWQLDGRFEPGMAELREAAACAPGQGLAGRVWETGRPAWTQELAARLPTLEGELAVRMGQGAAVALPVASGEEVLGVLAFTRRAPGAFENESVPLLEALSDQLAVFVDRVRRTRQADALRDAALTDALTGLPNRRAWDERLREHVSWADRHDQPLCLALIDLDRFKTYNDERGHQAGDALLARTARRWSSLVRRQDVLARYGGEEFALALPACELEEAEEIAERLRAHVPGGETCSIGLVLREPGEGAVEALARADAALYAGKRAGRDRVVVAPGRQAEPQPA